MTSELSQAFYYRKQKEYQKAVEIYNPIWQNGASRFTEWDGWSYAFCLKELKRYQEALEICRLLYPRFKNSEFIRNLYAQCIFYSQLKTKHLPDLPIHRKAVTAMVQLSPPNQKYSLSGIAIFHLCKELMKFDPVPWGEIEAWLQKMDPDLLDDRPFQMNLPNGRKSELASPLEEWYSLMIRAKGGLSQPQHLLDLLGAARRRKLKWHYNNDIWFERKEAFALHRLGQKEKAENILRRIIKIKNEWYLLFDLAQIVADKKEALQLMARAALSPGKSEMKLKLFETLYKSLSENQQYTHEANLHLYLTAAIREEKNWPVKPEISEKIQLSEINPIAEGSSSKVISGLTPFWKKLAGVTAPQRREGTISNILPNKISGFLKSGKDSFFANFKGVKGTPKIGAKVSFDLTDSFDKKKNKPSKMAININVL